MKISEILDQTCILTDLKSGDKKGVLEELANTIVHHEPSVDKNSLVKVLLERERLGSTGIGDGVAIPHGKYHGVSHPIVSFGRSKKGLDFDSIDGEPSHLFFLLVAPENSASIHLKALDKSKDWVLNQIAKFVTKAKQDFEYVSLGLQDASRADMDFLLQFVKLATDINVDRIRLADTVGVWDPIQTYQAIHQIRKHTPGIHIGFHAHNDLGMATANSIAAIRAGANSVDVTVNGLGDRAGNASLDEVVMASQVSLGIDSGIDSRQLVDLAIMVESASGRTLPVNKPITGKSVFLHESGIHVHALIRDRKTYEPFDPEMVGQHKSEFVLGKHSGRSALRYVLSSQGLSPNENEEKILLDLIQKSAIRKKEAMSDELTVESHPQVA